MLYFSTDHRYLFVLYHNTLSLSIPSVKSVPQFSLKRTIINLTLDFFHCFHVNPPLRKVRSPRRFISGGRFCMIRINPSTFFQSYRTYLISSFPHCSLLVIPLSSTSKTFLEYLYCFNFGVCMFFFFSFSLGK